MNKPIGVFDSGVGGLTVLRAINDAFPRESTVYLGDNTRAPYGSLPPQTVRHFSLECMDHLYYEEGIKALVIACNTSTSVVLRTARQRYLIPVVGVVEPTATRAARVAGARVGVVATLTTIKSESYLRAILEANPRLEVYQQPCPLLTGLVEAGEFDGLKTETVLENYLQPLRDRDVDTLVLGCTHYPFLRPAIERLVGPRVRIVESGPPTVDELGRLMLRGELSREMAGQPTRRMLTTGDRDSFRRVASTLWPEGLPEIEEVCVEADVEQVSG